MTLDNNSESSEFSELIHFIGVLTDLLKDCVEILRNMDDLPGEIAIIISELSATIDEHSSEVIRDILSNNYSSQLVAHGLNNNSAEWRFKYALFVVRLNRFRVSTAIRPQSVTSAQKWLRRIGAVFKPANVILRSVAAAIPGVAGAFSEIKDGMEVAAEIGARGRQK